jgi:hypothetical protein
MWVVSSWTNMFQQKMFSKVLDNIINEMHIVICN